MTTRFGAARLSAAPLRALVLAASAALLCSGPALAQAPRAAELVSPPDMAGDMAQLGFFSPAGDQAAFTSWGAFAGMPLSGQAQTYVSRRGADGIWVTTPVLIPNGRGVLASADSGPAVLALVASPTVAGSDLVLADDATGTTTTVATATSTASPQYAGSTDDLSTIFFTVGTTLFEWHANTATADPVTVPGGGGVTLGAGLPSIACASCSPRALSSDGTRIVVTSPPPPTPGGGTHARLFVRDEGHDAVPLTAAPSADEIFAGGSSDLSTIVMSTKAALDATDTDTASDVYVVTVGGNPAAVQSLTRVSTGDAGGNGTTCAGAAKCAATPMVVSDDGSTVAFVSPEVLTSAGGAQLNKPNLYVARNTGAGWTTTFVATLASTAEAVPANMRISADGGRLDFLTKAALLPADTDSSVDLYAWDATAATPLSILSQGDPGSGNGADDVAFGAAQPGYSSLSSLAALPRGITADGACAFFQTTESLVAADVNGKSDVYENCDGATTLLSSGQSADDSNLLNSSPTGDDVLIVTTDALSIEDVDGGPSLYDLRVGGRIPPVPPAPCSGDACQGPPSAPPALPVIVSNGFASASSSAIPTGPLVLSLPTPGVARAATRRGRLRVRAAVPGPGTLTIRATAKLGKKTRTIALGRSAVNRQGTATLTLKVSKGALRALRRRALRVTLFARYAATGVDTSDSGAFTLPRKRRSHR